ncbi:MAG: hypothetical protein KBC84_04365 [Proteobacteria bacterium]|nr:hypothetical protein [Pseudomonadota bacterium]
MKDFKKINCLLKNSKGAVALESIMCVALISVSILSSYVALKESLKEKAIQIALDHNFNLD